MTPATADKEKHMDAFALLIGDHNRVRGLFAKFKAAHEKDSYEEMATLCAKIFAELEVHTTIEEEIFYPGVRGEEELGETVDEALQEHHVVKVLMAEIRELEPTAAEWAAKMTVLIENVDHHAGEEEDEMFPMVRSSTDDGVLDRIGDQMDARKGELGAPTMADREGFNQEELMVKAREQEIPGRSSMSTDELRAAVDPR